MIDFRKIETCLGEFFRREGVGTTSADGDLFMGVCSTRLKDVAKTPGSNLHEAVLDVKPEAKVVSLTSLAKQLAREF